MRLPKQSAPVQRDTITRSAIAEARDGVRPFCTPLQNNQIGRCWDHNGPVPGSFNCAACCALRGSVFWVGPNGDAVAC